MRPDERDSAYLWDMWAAARRIGGFVQGVSAREFAVDEMRHSAVERQLIIIGEAARRVSQSFKEGHPEVPWGRMIGLRNLVTHEYERVDLDVIWEVATQSVPELASLLDPLIPPPPQEP